MTLKPIPFWLSTCFFLLATTTTSFASPQALVLDLYQTPDGAVTVTEHGNFIDPYFANRALTLADESGMDVRAVAERWIPWLIAHQLPDGRFQRYCKSGGSDWSACEPSDADDAGFAVWLELLYRLAPDSGLPVTWQASAAQANKDLEALRDKNTGLYFVSHELRVCLLMDNVEIYRLFRVMASANRRFGQQKFSIDYGRKADQLASAIVRRMWSPAKHRFAVSTQHPLPTLFYPAAVAQVYPWLFKLPTPAGDAKRAFRNWLRSYGNIWLQRSNDKFPWGIIALAADRFEETAWVNRWVENSQSLRHSAYWTVLDETLVQVLQVDRH
jgi:hypothetical protein